jgi:poly-beta-1,6-N-acetyl-D-glucosamine synthase
MAPSPTPCAATNSGVDTAHGRITVLIPAHNEQAGIGHAIESVRRQTRAVDEIVVIADNCTDGTAEVAAGHGGTVARTVGNTLNLLWYAVAACTLISAGFALMRLVPRRRG